MSGRLHIYMEELGSEGINRIIAPCACQQTLEAMVRATGVKVKLIAIKNMGSIIEILRDFPKSSAAEPRGLQPHEEDMEVDA